MTDEHGAAAADFEAALRQFRAEFAQQLPQRLQDAHARLDECRAAPADDDALRELHRVLHRLAGSAGTFGMPALGDAARSIEEDLDALLQKGDRSAADFEPVARRIAALPGFIPAS